MTPATHYPPQQNLASLPRCQGISATIHVAGLLFCIASFAWLPNITNPLHDGFGRSYQFLTIIALTMSTITFGVSLFGDVFYNEQLFALKNVLSVCATPLEVLVGTMYWSLHAIDKSLVIPPGHALPFIPNLGLHAIPAIMLTLDMLASPPWFITAPSAMMLGLVFLISYWAWLEYCFSFNGWYPYPLLVHLSTGQKLLLCICSAGLMTGSTMGLKWVYGRINEVEGLGRGVFDPIHKMD